MTGVYAIRHKESGRVYVGSSKDIYARWAQHVHTLERGSHRSKYLQRAWQKYGADAFEFIILETCDHDKRVVREQVCIDFYRASEPEFGFNMSRTAGVPIMSVDGRARLSIFARNRPATTRTLMSFAARNRSAKHRAKLIAAARNRSAATRKKLAAAQKGRQYTSEARAKMSASAKRRWASKEARAMLSARARNMLATQRERISQSNRRRMVSADTRAKMSESQRLRRMRESEAQTYTVAQAYDGSDTRLSDRSIH